MEETILLQKLIYDFVTPVSQLGSLALASTTNFQFRILGSSCRERDCRFVCTYEVRWSGALHWCACAQLKSSYIGEAYGCGCRLEGTDPVAATKMLDQR